MLAAVVVDGTLAFVKRNVFTVQLSFCHRVVVISLLLFVLKLSAS